MAITDPNALAHIVHTLGGTVDPASENFQFTLPLASVKSAVPKITAIAGVGVRKVGNEFVDESPTGPQTIVRLELYQRLPENEPTPRLTDMMQW